MITSTKISGLCLGSALQIDLNHFFRPVAEMYAMSQVLRPRQINPSNNVAWPSLVAWAGSKSINQQVCVSKLPPLPHLGVSLDANQSSKAEAGFQAVARRQPRVLLVQIRACPYIDLLPFTEVLPIFKFQHATIIQSHAILIR